MTPSERPAYYWMVFLAAFAIIGIIAICGGILGMTIYFLRVS